MTDWVWVVGGGRIQEPLIREYVARGFKVCVGDKDPMCWATRLSGEGLPVEVYMVDTHDSHSQLEVVKSVTQGTPGAPGFPRIPPSPPRAVMTAGTDVGPTVSLIAETFNLPGVPYDVAYEVKSKPIMRQLVDTPHPWWSTWKPLEYPCVEKPWGSSGSKGVKVLWSDRDFKFKQGFLWEEYLQPHVEASTDWMMDGGYPVYVNGAWRWFDDDTFGLEVGWVNPFVLEPGVQDLAIRASRRLGVQEGPFKMDILRDKQYGWTLLECATRWSGSFDHTVGATLSTGRNLSAALVDYSLGLPFDPKYGFSQATIHQYAGAYTPPLKGEWKVTEEMLQSIKEEPGVVDVIPLRWSGGTVTTLAERPLFIFGVGSSIGSVREVTQAGWQRWREVERTVNLGGGGE